MPMCKWLGLLTVVALVGCSGQGDPPQPKLTDEQIKEVMKQGAERREGQDARGNLPAAEAPTAKKQ